MYEREKRLLRLLGEIDDELIEAAMSDKPRRKRRKPKWWLVVVCLCIGIAVLCVIPFIFYK